MAPVCLAQGGALAPAPEAPISWRAAFAGNPGVPPSFQDGRIEADGSSSARFNGPTGMVAGPNGEVYVADTANHVIRWILPDGTVGLYAGTAGSAGDSDSVMERRTTSVSGSAGSSTLQLTGGVTASSLGIVQGTSVSGAGIVMGARVASVAADGTTLTLSQPVLQTLSGEYVFASKAPPKFRSPRGLAIDGSGNLFVADTGNHLIRKISTGRTVTTVAGVRGAGGFADGPFATALFSQPHAVALIPPPAGSTDFTLVVADTGNHRIRSITQTGVTTLAGEGTPSFFDGSGLVAKFSSPKGLAVLSTNGVTEMYVADSGNHAIRKIVRDNVLGIQVSSVAGVTAAGASNGAGHMDGAAVISKFNGPLGIAAVNSTRLLVTETDQHTVRLVDLTNSMVSTVGGQFSQSPGAVDGVGTASKFNIPSGIAVTGEGRIYVSNAGSHVVSVGQIPVGSQGGYSWSIFAGSLGGPGVADGGTTVCRFTAPQAMARNPATGDVFVVDGQTIRKVAPSGQTTLFAGVPGQSGGEDSGGSILARFNDPAALAVGSGGIVYVADAGNNKIRSVAPSGMVSTLSLSTTLNSPSGIVVGTEAGGGEVLYVADSLNQRILKLSLAGAVLMNYSFSQVPQALALRGNDLFFTAPSRNLILKLDIRSSANVPVVVAGTDALEDGFLDSSLPLSAQFRDPTGLQVDGDGNLYVVDRGNHCIRRVGTNRVTTYAGIPEQDGFLDGAGTGAPSGFGVAQFFRPGGLVLVPPSATSVGEIWVADSGNFCVRKVTMDAARRVNLVAGTPTLRGFTDGPAIGPRFVQPKGVAVDLEGTVYVSDPENHVIRRIKGGQVITFAGAPNDSGFRDGSVGVSRFSEPEGLAVDRLGNLYVADRGNHAIRRVTKAGVVTTLVGFDPEENVSLSGEHLPVSGDQNGSAAMARFNGPRGVAVDNSFNVYVADSGNYTIRKIKKGFEASEEYVETFAGISGISGGDTGPREEAQFYNPTLVAVTPDGTRVYVGDQGSASAASVRRIEDGVVSIMGQTVATGEDLTAAYFPDLDVLNLGDNSEQLGGLAVDASGTVFVSYPFQCAVYRFPAESDTIRVQIGGAPLEMGAMMAAPGNRGGVGTDSRFFGPLGVAVAPSGDLYVANWGAASVLKAVPPSSVTPVLKSPTSDTLVSGNLSVEFSLPEPAMRGSLRVQFRNALVNRVLVLSADLESAGEKTLAIRAGSPEKSPSIESVQPFGGKIPSGEYSVQVFYRSLAGIERQSVRAERVFVDAETQPPLLTSPASKAVFASAVRLNFSLPEPAAAGSLVLKFNDGLNPRELVLAGSQETKGAHSFDLNPQDPLAGGFVVSGDPVPPGSYTVSLSYRDQRMNDAAVATSNGVLIRGTAPVLVLPEPNTASRAPVTVQFSLPSPAKRGSLRLQFTNAESEVRQLVLGSALEKIGGRFNFDPASPAGSSAAVVSGPSIPDGVYSVRVNYQSATGAQTMGPVTGFRIDTVTEEPTLSSFSDSSPGAAQISFSLPEAAKPGSVMLAFRPSGGSGTVPKLILATQHESQGGHTATVDLRNPPADSAQVAFGDAVPNGIYDLVLTYTDILENHRAFGVLRGVTVSNGIELIPLRVGYSRHGSGTPLIFTFTLTAPGSPSLARFIFRDEKTDAESELVLAGSFLDGQENTVGFDPLNTGLGGRFLSAPASLAVGSYAVTLKYTKTGGAEAQSRELSGVRVLDPASSDLSSRGDKVLQVSSGGGVMAGGSAPAGLQATLGGGFKFLRFGVPSATGDGGMAYHAVCANAVRERVRGVFVSDSVDPVAIQGQQAPGTALPYLLFGTPVVNRSGDLAFSALLDAEDPETGLWVRRGGVLGLVFRASQAVVADGGESAFLDGVTNIALADNGDLFFTALRSEPVPEGADPEDEDSVPRVFSLWRQNSFGQIAELLSTGSMVGVGGGQSREVKTILAFAAMPDTPGQRRGFNKNGVLVARVEFTDQTAALVKFDSGSESPVVLLKTGSQNLDGESVNIGSLGLVSVGDDGGMVVRIGLVQDGTGVTPDNDQMLVAISSTSVVTILAQEGDQITAGGNAVVLRSVGNPVGGQAGGYAFVGSISAVPTEGQTTAPIADPVILKRNGSGFDVLARKGGSAPGVAGAQFNQIRSLAWPGNEGVYGPAFVASLKTGGGVTSANDVGLWAQNSSGNLVLLLREGDFLSFEMGGKTVRLFSVLSAVSGSASQGHSTVGEGTYAVRVVFTDLTEAVINVSVP